MKPLRVLPCALSFRRSVVQRILLLGVGTLSASALTCFMHVPQAYSENAVVKRDDLARVKFRHLPVNGDELPFPGQPYKLRVELEGTKNFARPLRAVASIDGRLLDLRAEPGVMNEYDRVTYVVPVHSPLVELSYQFFLSDEDGRVISSEQYRSHRSCVPETTPVKLGIPPEVSSRDKLELLSHQAKRLERESSTYSRILKLLEELKPNLGAKGAP